MRDLIEPPTIVQKYVKPGNHAENYPTHSEHDTPYVSGIEDWKSVSHAHKNRLGKLGLSLDKDEGDLVSYRFGSC